MLEQRDDARRSGDQWPNAAAKMLPKPFGTGTNGTASRIAAIAVALSVASPPTATRCVIEGPHVWAQRSSAGRSAKVWIDAS